MATAGYTCAIHSTLRRHIDTRGFYDIKDVILGKHYHLSIVLIGDRRARTLNRTHRNKDIAANVLSFPLDVRSGEIFLNVTRIEREARKFQLSPMGHLRYLLIHGCLHLKGHQHGSTMEQAETKLLTKFHIR